MKKIYADEKWCLGCHLCEYYCAYANSNEKDMIKALKDLVINPRIRVEENDSISFAISCRHCEEPLCVKGCISGALRINDGVITVDEDKCIGCYTCIMCCPYGAVSPGEDGIIQKCELCMNNSHGAPQCVKGCPNNAIVFEEKGDV